MHAFRDHTRFSVEHKVKLYLYDYAGQFDGVAVGRTFRTQAMPMNAKYQAHFQGIKPSTSRVGKYHNLLLSDIIRPYYDIIIVPYKACCLL